jgi:Mn2+/Fe2+ NRAMP family transporter
MRTGTSSLVVAAFVGPGTVLTCASAGVQFGYQLGWVLLFATVTAFVLQSFTASTGIVARKGLGTALRDAAPTPAARTALFGLVVTGLWIGCASFEVGNLLGAASGITALLDLPVGDRVLVAVIGGLAGLILLLDLRVLIRVFAVLVVGMSALFVAGLLLAPVDWGAALRGLAVPTIPDGGTLTVIALVGTTVVTYNLFLHASAAKQYWADAPDRPAAWRAELRGMGLFLPLGGLISFSILAAGATLAGASGAAPESAEAFTQLLAPVAGPWARLCFGLGLFAAGLTSSLTAPLAAAGGICELFGWDDAPTARPARLVWGSVLATGVGVGLAGFSPLPAIIAAQAANGLLLPVIAGLVLLLTWRQERVTLPAWYRALGVLVTCVCAGLGLRTLWWVWQQL